MASLTDQYLYSQTQTLQNQVKQALVSAAIAISGEAQANNRNRTALAIRVLAPGGVTNYLQQFAAAVVNDATVSASIAAGGASASASDAQIQNAVNAAWNAVANA
jgi:hypothetical protein